MSASALLAHLLPSDTVTAEDESPSSIELETASALPNARTYCQEQGFDWGTYSDSKGISGDTLSITCYPEEDGSWTTYYFDLNMSVIDKEVTTTQ